MAQVWTMGEILCEIMRPEAGQSLDTPGVFLGPYPSGAPANFIDTVARLGHSAGIIGGVGKDDFGRCVLTRLKNDGVDCTQVLESEHGSTGVAFVTYFEDGSRRFIFHFPNTPATWAKAPESDVYGDDVKYFHIMGCSLMADAVFAEEIIKVAAFLRTKGVKISFDPNIRPELLCEPRAMENVRLVMSMSSILMPGVSELLAITEGADLQSGIDTLFKNPLLEILVLKNGENGSRVYTREQSFFSPIYTVEVKDTTGAGDAFDAAFICGLLEGRPLPECAKMASAAAALNTAAFGPMEGDISKKSLAGMLGEYCDSGAKLTSPGGI